MQFMHVYFCLFHFEVMKYLLLLLFSCGIFSHAFALVFVFPCYRRCCLPINALPTHPSAVSWKVLRDGIDVFLETSNRGEDSTPNAVSYDYVLQESKSLQACVCKPVSACVIVCVCVCVFVFKSANFVMIVNCVSTHL